ncbi:hypothetical protein [Heyndrickxia sporothermodurans]|uniref:Transposase n=1 Tax=Heyndrickxia sporothermodurans TaxID=46224 RepID=A0AB37HFJ7_9BACI|nr:hypothetical protein JGZ69_06935 [Heyndrickxia sporothermodurans]
MVKDENEVRKLSQQEVRWLLEGLSIQQPKYHSKITKRSILNKLEMLVYSHFQLRFLR